MASTDEIASAGTYLSKDKGVEVTDGTQVRVTLGVINSTTGADGSVTPIDYGLRVVSSDGTTVIVDGTSDMFKIAATGTLSQSNIADAASASGSVTLTGLGALSATPAMLPMTAYDVHTSGITASSVRYAGAVSAPFAAAWLATTSGGAVTARMVGNGVSTYTSCNLDVSNQAVVTFAVYNHATFALDFATRYYVLTEVSI